MPTGTDNLGPDGQPLSFTQYEPGSHLYASGYDTRSDINDDRERQRQAAAAPAPAPAPAQGQAAKTGPFGLWGGRSRRSRRSRKSKRSKRSKSRRR